MGQPDTLEGWIRSTDALAQEMSQQRASPRVTTKKQHKNKEVEAPVAQLPKTVGTIFQLERPTLSKFSIPLEKNMMTHLYSETTNVMRPSQAFHIYTFKLRTYRSL